MLWTHLKIAKFGERCYIIKYNINIKLINQSSKNKIRRSGIVLSNIKLKNLGWNVKTSLREGIAKTLKVFEEKK